MNISYKFHRFPDTQSRVIKKVYNVLGQPSYIKLKGMEHRAQKTQAHILSSHTSLASLVGSKGFVCFFKKISMLHIKLKGMAQRSPHKHILFHSLGHWGWVKRFVV